MRIESFDPTNYVDMNPLLFQICRLADLGAPVLPWLDGRPSYITLPGTLRSTIELLEETPELFKVTTPFAGIEYEKADTSNLRTGWPASLSAVDWLQPATQRVGGAGRPGDFLFLVSGQSLAGFYPHMIQDLAEGSRHPEGLRRNLREFLRDGSLGVFKSVGSYSYDLWELSPVLEPGRQVTFPADLADQLCSKIWRIPGYLPSEFDRLKEEILSVPAGTGVVIESGFSLNRLVQLSTVQWPSGVTLTLDSRMLYWQEENLECNPTPKLILREDSLNYPELF